MPIRAHGRRLRAPRKDFSRWNRPTAIPGRIRTDGRFILRSLDARIGSSRVPALVWQTPRDCFGSRDRRSRQTGSQRRGSKARPNGSSGFVSRYPDLDRFWLRLPGGFLEVRARLLSGWPGRVLWQCLLLWRLLRRRTLLSVAEYRLRWRLPGLGMLRRCRLRWRYLQSGNAHLHHLLTDLRRNGLGRKLLRTDMRMRSWSNPPFQWNVRCSMCQEQRLPRIDRMRDVHVRGGWGILHERRYEPYDLWRLRRDLCARIRLYWHQLYAALLGRRAGSTRQAASRKR